MEPIAVIGLDLKFPGDATDADGFWDMLVTGRSACTDIPDDRFKVSSFYHPDPERSGSLNVTRAHFLKDEIAAFDAPFFSITPAEAGGMDPQQRGLLENTYRALENAGCPMNKVLGTNTGVFIGCFTREYEAIMFKETEIQQRYFATGTGTTMLANRLSYFYDLHGPSINLDTACSSSLNACHLAWFGMVVLKRLSDAIRDGDCIRAIVRGSSSNQDGNSPGITQPTRQAQVDLINAAYQSAGLSKTQTRFFEAHGTGTPVGDPIEASAISGAFSEYRSEEEPMVVGAVKTNIGHLEGSAGIAGLIKAIMVLEKGIIPPNMGFQTPNPKIPVHGWHLKFPTKPEAWPSKGLRRASINAFGYGGSNAHIIIDDAYHYLLEHGLKGKHQTIEFPPVEGLKSSINGTNGTNGHSNGITNGHANGHQSTSSSSDDEYILVKRFKGHGPPSRSFFFSTFDEAGAVRMAQAYKEFLDSTSKSIVAGSEEEQRFLSNLSFTLIKHRTPFPWLFSVAADSIAALSNKLEGSTSPVRATTDPKLGFVFTGQGAQWYAMGRELLSAYPTCSTSIFAADLYLRELGCPWSLVGELLQNQDKSRIDDPALSQPICTALQVALVDLLATWGIKPAAVVGHSSGEIGAAYATGAISQESAWRLAFYRGALSSRLAKSPDHTNGAMLSVAMSSPDAMSYLEEHVGSASGRDIVVACINSPRNVTLSGSAAYIDKIKAASDSDGVFARKLKVDNGYHSPLMATIADEYRNLIGDLEAGTNLSPGQVAPVFYSSLGGTVSPASALQNPDHWVDNLVSPVQFSKAFSLMCSNTSSSAPVKKLGASAKATVKPPKITQVLEIGPHAALRGPIREIMELTPEVSGIGYESVLRRGTSAVDNALGAANWLWCRGYEVDMSDASIAKDSSLVVNAPGYPFNHSNIYWNESRISKGYRFRPAMRHELFGAPVPDWDPANAVWRNYMRLSENPWVKHHRITGATIYPAAGMLVMAIEASRQMADISRVVKGFRILDARFNVALRVPATQNGLETHFYMQPSRDHPDTVARTVRKFSLSSYEGGEWREHCHGLVVTEYEQPYTVVDDGREDFEFQEACKNRLTSVEKASKVETSFRQLYEHLSTVGLDFGATFQTLRDIRCGDIGEAVATVERQDLESLMPLGYLQDHLIHPTVLDGILQSIIVSLTKGGREIDQVMVPSEIGDLWVSADPSTSKFDSVRVSCSGKFLGIRQAEARIVGMDVDTGKVVCTVDNFVITTVARSEGASSSDAARRLCFNLDYKVDPAFLDQETADKTLQPDAKCGATTQQAQLIQEVEMMCFLYIKRFWDRIYDENRDAKSVPYHKKYIAWIRHQLEKYDAGLIPHAMPEWRERAADDEYISQMETKLLKEGSAEGKLVVNVGRELPNILAGKSDALELLFKDKLVENVYRSGVGAEIVYDRMVAYIDALAHKNPALRVLEVGAGTGGATRPILKCLTTQGNGETGTPRFSHYAFTDISIGFFENAREMFKDSAARMSFRALNIEENLEQQGFSGPGEQYDVICAANVIHATKNLEATLSNARKLLKPGGKLILYEMTNTGMIRTGFAFGLLPGWWLSVEDFRQFTPLAAPNDWSRSLKASGFSGIDLHIYDFPDHRHQMVSVLICTALGDGSEENAPATSYSSSPIKIITCGAGSGSATQESLAAILEKQAASLSTSVDVVNLHDAVADLKDLQQTRCIFLGDIESDFLEHVHDDDYEAFRKLIGSTKTLLWVNQGGGPSPKNPGADMVTGFARCMRAENPGLNFVTLSVDDWDSFDKAGSIILRILSSGGGSENTFFEKEGAVYIPRITEANTVNHLIAAKTKGEPARSETWQDASNGRALTLQCAVPGLLDSLQFQDDELYEKPLGPYDVEVRVHATGLNLLDVMIALGQVISEAFGQECAGVVTRVGTDVERVSIGDSVCGLLRRTFKTFARGSQWQFDKIPSTIDYAVASAVPVVYTTAYYGLHDLARLQAGESILIHWGAGGVGQAAIQLAKAVGAEVFVTVGSIEKRDFMHKHYGIPLHHVLSSRDLSFVHGIKRLTDGRGVDVTLNSTAGQTLHASWDCIAPYRQFIEIGKVDIFANAGLPIGPFKKSITFSFFDISLIPLKRGRLFSRVLQDIVNLLAKGSITPPQPLHIYSYSDIQEAFKIIQSGSHIGKLILKAQDDNHIMVKPSQKPTYYFDPDASYLLSGGLGGLRRSAAPQELMKELAGAGVTASAPQCDVSDRAALKRVLNDCSKTMPPIKGYIQGSIVLKDSIFSNLSQEDYYTAIRPKVVASRNLHELLPQNLDFFILLSSASGVVGNRGQSNYCIGNTYQDSLARHRVTLGLPGIAVDLGIILSVRFAAKNQESMANLRQEGFNAMQEDKFLALLDILCDPNGKYSTNASQGLQASSFAQIAVGLKAPATLRIKGIPKPAWMTDPLFKHLYQIRGEGNHEGKGDGKGSATSYSTLLPAAASLADAAKIVSKAIIQKLCKALSSSERDINVSKPLHSYGVDFLIAVELRAWFMKEVGSNVAIFDIMSVQSLEELAELAAKRSSFASFDNKKEAN
ncbi:Asperfuranone polyketide synthase afoG [Fusarium proliferatum]|uniref:Asperfuranone polyketide synthase afoG n=1 Tax=Gibberella intermedia TaxID=948311 RepID=A0A420SQ69_GIBIN|nr:Asperfuranone polyketide synthase afoG [Fusarium proliferatum]